MAPPSSSAAVGQTNTQPEPIDLEALEREAKSTDGDRTVVSRAWLQRALQELAAARRAKAILDEVFGPGWVIR